MARVEAHRVLAEAAMAKGDYTKVLRLTEDILHSTQRDRHRAGVARVRAAALLRLDRVDEAADLLRDRGAREDLIRLGTTYLHLKDDPEKAYAILESALSGTEKAGERSPALLTGWLAMVDAADEAGKHERAAAALRTVIKLFPDKATMGMQYRLARLESVGASPARAAERYAAAARVEGDPLLARAAAADAAYYRVLREAE
jgi:tetratricopeptide (TPR) repeat protein